MRLVDRGWHPSDRIGNNSLSGEIESIDRRIFEKLAAIVLWRVVVFRKWNVGFVVDVRTQPRQ